jgi:DinB family protein
MGSAYIDLLVWNLQPPPGRKNWHGGPSPVGALRGVTAAAAAWRPTPRRKTIWELALHIAYWKYTVRRHLESGERPRFPRSPANFPAQPEPANERAWAHDVALLRDEHQRLVAAVRGVAPGRLADIPREGRRWTYGELVLGIAAHDAYHTGQIQLLKRLWQERGLLGRGGRRG